MANLNRIVLIGRLMEDPESRTTLNGIPMTRFRLAVERQGGLAQDIVYQGGTDFIDVISWRRLAENCSARLKKGQLVLAEGRIQNRSFEDQMGQRRFVTEVVAVDVRQLGEGKNVPLPTAGAGTKEEERAEDEASLASELPF